MSGHTFIQRSWCRHCVAARAGNPAHRGRRFPTAIEEDKDTRQVSYDFCFMQDQPGMESAKILVSKDRATRMVSAHVVPLKGALLDWVIQQCARDLERLGHYGQVTLKYDQVCTVWMLQKMKFAMVTRFLIDGCPHGTLRLT